MKTTKQTLDALIDLTTDLIPEDSRGKYEKLYGDIYTDIDDYELKIQGLESEVNELGEEIDGRRSESIEFEDELDKLKENCKDFIPQTQHDEMKLEILKKVMKHLNLNQVEQIEKEFNLKDKV